MAQIYFKSISDALAKTLSYVSKEDAAGAASELMFEKYGTLDRILSADANILACEEKIGAKNAHFVKLIASVISRAKTEEYKFGAKHTPEETDEYFKALLLPRSVECVYAMSFDAKGRAIACDLVSEGVVNSSELLPRKIVEIATRRRAVYMILAHNHPHGVANPSDDDISSTMSIARILSNLNIKLVRHIIVSGNHSASIGVGGEL